MAREIEFKRRWVWTPIALLVVAAGSYAAYRALQPEPLPEGLVYGNGRVEGTEVRLSSEVAGRVAWSAGGGYGGRGRHATGANRSHRPRNGGCPRRCRARGHCARGRARRHGTARGPPSSRHRRMSRDIAIVQGGKKHKPPREEVGYADNNPSYKQTYIKVVANPPGTGLAGLAAHPDYIALPAEVFANYLHHEGMTDALEAFKAENKLTTIRERYTKHAKSIFQVGKTLSDDWKTPLGFKVEIFAERNLSELKVGEEMPIRVLAQFDS